MQIKDMFERDIDRYINGVVNVSDEEGVAQELDEYVVTHELQGHFATFFDAYERGIDQPERNIGVWIQGYFGSGKSHFLKMLSYLLENKPVNGKPTVDYFAGKFEDEMTYARVKRAAEVPAETILFNIDEKGAGYKEGDTSETAVLRSIARVFYEHLGFYGEDYKLARFEKAIDDKGATEAFRSAFNQVTGEDWLEARDTYDFYGEEVAQAANQAAGLSVKSISDWADSTESTRIQIGDLVDDIDEYARRREAECGGTFRLVFMIDEMGQYLNGDVGRMLNLQTLVEQFCDRCGGRVWMVVTSQEAIDEMMNVVSMDFSKIQGRFGTRLSLSSSSVDEVIKRRVLEKNQNARIVLDGEYDAKSAVLNNLFAFSESRGDLRGYAGKRAFVESFPFVGYQFTLMPDVLKEIRRHGYQGKSLSTGERSMLSSYQEAAQAVEGQEEGALVPFWRFFDTLEKELDHGVKQVFERCRRAAKDGVSLKPADVDVLKVLYLINYINDIKPTAGNIAILLVDAIDVDMADLRERVKKSLERLVRENYVARNGERYSFLTDEEQDVAREIRDVQVDPSAVIEEIKHIVFDGIFKERKHRKGANDFPFDRYVDDTIYGQSANGMKLNLITLADEELSDVSDAVLDMKSSGQALLVLDTSSDYYEVLYNAARIRKYVQTQNVAALPLSKRNIIQAKQEEAATNRKEAEGLISEAILKGRVSVDGHGVKVPAANARQKISGVLDELVDCTFTKASLVDTPIENDAQLCQVLGGALRAGLDGEVQNHAAVDAMDKYLESRERTHQPTTMGDVQRAFQARPYGWREIDIASVAAQLIACQKATISFGGSRIDPSDRKACDYLRKASEVDKVTVRKRVSMPPAITRRAKSLLRELDGTVQIPDDEDGLVRAVRECLEGRVRRYGDLFAQRYQGGSRYPGGETVREAVALAKTIMGQSADPEAFLREFGRKEDALLDNAEDLEAVETFFDTNQLGIFDRALSAMDLMEEESIYTEGDAEVGAALAEASEVVSMEKPYGRIKDLPGIVKRMTGSYGKLVARKRDAVLEQLDSSADQVREYAATEGAKAEQQVQGIVRGIDQDVLVRKDKIHAAGRCSQLDTIKSQVEAWRDAQLRKIDGAVAQAQAQGMAKESGPGSHGAQQGTANPARPRTKVVKAATVLPPRVMHDEGEIDDYLAQLKARLVVELKGADGIRIG